MPTEEDIQKLLALATGQQPKKASFETNIEAFKTSDPTTLKARDYAVKLSSLPDPVLITGESGTGKELIAKILHGSRRPEKFIGVNVNAVSENLFESELFGHIKGAFTGAYCDKFGLVESADSGTLFLDEIGDLKLDQQVKLLRLLQDKTYRRVGDTNLSIANCRFVFATHRDLKSMVQKETFRADLYYRIKSFNIHIPPLRFRMEDLRLYGVTEELYELILMKRNTVINEAFAENREYSTYLGGNVRQLLNLKRQVEVLGIDSLKQEDLD